MQVEQYWQYMQYCILPTIHKLVSRSDRVSNSVLLIAIYPGMHLLEMAKTAWNAIVTTEVEKAQEEQLLRQAQEWLAGSRKILSIFGPEGDKGGPLEEIRALQKLLDSN